MRSRDDRTSTGGEFEEETLDHEGVLGVGGEVEILLEIVAGGGPVLEFVVEEAAGAVFEGMIGEEEEDAIAAGNSLRKLRLIEINVLEIIQHPRQKQFGGDGF